MTIETDRQYLDRIRELAAADDREGLDAAISALEPSEAIRAILRLEAEDQQSVLTTLSPPEAADLGFRGDSIDRVQAAVATCWSAQYAASYSAGGMLSQAV